jgi:hypothetical protein
MFVNHNTRMQFLRRVCVLSKETAPSLVTSGAQSEYSAVQMLCAECAQLWLYAFSRSNFGGRDTASDVIGNFALHVLWYKP